mgnify:CR=1 FL=1
MTPADYEEAAARMLSEAIAHEGGYILGMDAIGMLYESAAALVNASNEHWESWVSHRNALVDFRAKRGHWFELTQDDDGNIYINGERRDD